jgi:hypothetical protein
VRRNLITLAIAATVVVSACSGGSKGQVSIPGKGLCESYVATAAQATPGPGRVDWLDRSIKTCKSLEQWQSAVTAYAADAIGPSATGYLADRCAESTSGLSGYQLCGLLAISLATPTPAPTKKPKHKPKKTAKPKRTPAPAISPSPMPSSSLAPVRLPPPAVSSAPAPVPPPR